MEKKRKLVDSEEVPDSETINNKKKKKKVKKEHEENLEGSLEIQNTNDTSRNLSQDPDSQETNAKKDKKKKKKSIAQNEDQTSGSPLDSNNPENNDSKGEKLKKKKRKLEESGPNEDTNDIANGTTENVEPENNDTKREKRKRPKKAKAQNEVQSNNIAENGENKGNTEVESASTPFVEGDGITTPTTKKPPRNTGETKKQYKRRLKGLREAGLLIDPPVVEGVKKDKRNRKTRKEKRDTQAKKNEELERFRSIVQTNYLKMWKNDQSKWKFNKNVQGKLFKHMFDTSRIPQDMFEILIEYIASSKSPNVHTELNKKCSDVIEAMEKWTSASEEEKKKMKEKEDLTKKMKEKEELTKKAKEKEDLAKKAKEKGKEDAQKKIKEKVVEKPVEEDKPKIKCKKMDIQETKKDVREPSKRLIIKSQSSINESVQSNKKSTPFPQADGPDIEVMDEKYTKNPMRMYEVCKELKKMARNQSVESSSKLAETKKVKKVAALKTQYQIEELTAENLGSIDPSPKSCDGCKKIKPTTIKMDEPGKMFLFCSLYCGIRYKLRRVDTTQGLLKRRCCGHCNRTVVPDDKSLTWKTTNFCDEKCLSKYQQSLGDICGNCNTHIPVKFRGRYILQRNTLSKIFCSAVCRAYHKSANKYCAICCKVSEGSRVMIIGDYKICSQDCLKKFSSYKKTQGNMACCTVCHLNKPVQYDVLSTGDALNHLCSEKCFKAFNFVNKLDVLQCNLCEKFFDKTRQDDAVLCFFDDLYHNYCSRFCYQVYVSERTKKACAWCKGEKNELSMIRRVYENQEYFYCTLNCLNMLNVEKMVTAKSKQCDYCKAYSTDTFYISAYSATKSFCTYKCVYNFHNNVPLISDVRSLVAANVSKTLPPPAAPAPKALPPTKPARVVPNKIIKPKYEVTKILPKIIRQILIKPQEKKEMKNAATQVKPTTSTKRVSCKTTSVTKECQTGDDMGRPLLIPVPVPIYVPSPAAMFSVPFPILVPIPIPIPVPVFIPTTRNSAAGIFKEIKRIQEKIPADPFEAELLMMAEMVASDKKEEGGTTDDDSNAAEDDFDNEGGGMETSNNAFGEDVLQMAIKMACNDLETPSGGLQAVDLDDALQPATITITQAQRTENNSEDIDVQDAMFRGSNRGRKRGSNNKAPMSRAPPIKRQRRTSDLIPQPPQAAPPPPQPPVEIEKPDANMCLKYTFGVNAWRQWVINKNLELEKAAAAGNRKPNTIKLFKPEILQLTADELNFSLCLFVKEVRKPNGTQYAPDTIYYLCLGIQQYLFESGRIDNIFTDPYYEKFTEALDEVCCKFSALYNDTQFIVTRVEEEHLWESKQLGAHSPHVLLNTLMFFNTKHFNLITVEEHMQLSFSHIMKHWKRNPGMGGANIATNCTKAPPGSRNVLLRFYPPQSAIDAPGSRKKKVYEQQENEENPLRCPVRLYEFYLSKCPESVKTRNDVFYLLPERSCVPDSPVWYSTTPLNKEALMKMLHRIKMVKEINIAFLSL
uniref:Zinc finger MYM-type protein 3 n=1 Tax=Cacopsylla melanoneura TaxID=428564 RepID=A0A8D8Y4C8_9HEMI